MKLTRMIITAIFCLATTGTAALAQAELTREQTIAQIGRVMADVQKKERFYGDRLI